MGEVLHSHRQLIVWQKAVDLVCAVYALTEQFPSDERFGLIAQIRRSTESIPSNIAEGRGRGTRKEFVQFLRTAYGSATELDSHITVAKRLPATSTLDYAKVDSLLNEVLKMLGAMIGKLQPKLGS